MKKFMCDLMVAIEAMFIIWIVASFVSTIIVNTAMDPVYPIWNFFSLFFK